jgi:hypothetical protein
MSSKREEKSGGCNLKNLIKNLKNNHDVIVQKYMTS